jgi:peptidyl-prolyl cis-trans isomerase D
MAEIALDERARQLGLGISDDAVAKQIRAFPAFQGASGEFDHRLFVQRIRNAGFTEPRFVNEQRRQIVRQQLTQSIAGVAEPPRTLVDVVNRYQNERRAIEYVVLDKAQAGEVPDPTPEQLTDYFETRKALFRAPEYRKVTVLRLSNEDIARWLTISDDEARLSYNERRSRFVTPGRRHVLQIIFGSQDEAAAAKQKIDKGATFEDIARERGLSDKDIDLGLVAENALAPGVAKVAFALPEGGVSEPAQSRIGYALVKVAKIEAESVRSFDEAKEEIKSELARDRTRTEMNQKHDRIEDERAGGATLAEAAQKVGLQATTFEALDRSGRDPTGATVPNLPTDVDVLTPAFSTAVGVEADALRLPSGGYVWFEVNGITPSKERSLEEVKDRVAERWRQDQVSGRLKQKADTLMEKLKGGTSFADVAAAEQLKVETAADLRREAAAGPISSAAVSAIFRTGKGEIGAADGQAADERIVFRVTEIGLPPADANAADTKRIEESLRTALGQDLLTQYVTLLEKDLGATINQDALRRTVGGESQ